MRPSKLSVALVTFNVLLLMLAANAVGLAGQQPVTDTAQPVTTTRGYDPSVWDEGKPTCWACLTHAEIDAWLHDNEPVIWERLHSISVKCMDGWRSPSIGKRGACSSHGGVNYHGPAMDRADAYELVRQHMMEATP